MIGILDSDPGDALAGGARAAWPGDERGKSSVIYRAARRAEKHSLNLFLLIA